MNWLDIVIIVILAVLALLGLKRGLIKSLVPLVAIILAVALTGRFQGPVAERLTFISSESAARVVAFVIIVIVIFAGVYILGSMLRKILGMALLGWADRLGGALFGFATGWIVCSMLVVLLARYVALPVELPELPVGGLNESIESQLDLEGIRQTVYNTIDNSWLANTQMESVPIILGLLPEEFDAVRDFFGE